MLYGILLIHYRVQNQQLEIRIRWLMEFRDSKDENAQTNLVFQQQNTSFKQTILFFTGKFFVAY